MYLLRILLAQLLLGDTVPDFSASERGNPSSTEDLAESFCVFWFDMEGNVVPGWKIVSARTGIKMKLWQKGQLSRR